MTCLTTLVAGLTSRVERAAVGSGAVAGDVAQLAASIALHGLSLAVSSKMVGATTLVTGGGTSTASETTAAEATTISTSGNRSASAHADTSRVGARPGQMPRLAAVIAASTCAGATQAESRAVSLDMAQALAVVALFGLGGTRQRALVRLVS
jgi:hypothetical protein